MILSDKESLKDSQAFLILKEKYDKITTPA